MSYKDFQAFTAENCRGYKKIFEISIGGFLYLAFLPDAYHKILCISSDYMSTIDSENGQVTPIDGDYDEVELVAMCEGCDSPISIAGQYGGSLPLDNGEDIRVTMEKDQSGKYPILTIFGKRIKKLGYKFIKVIYRIFLVLVRMESIMLMQMMAD